MFAVDVCRLPATGGSTFVVVAGLFLLVAGVIVTRWVRASAGRMSVVVTPLVLLGGLVLAPSVTDPCGPTTTVVSTTTVAPTTTVVPVDQNLVLEIEKTGLSPVEIGSVTAADESFLFELGLFGEVDVHVDWGDGSADDVSAAGPFLHTYTTLGRYTITVSGSLTGFGQDPLISSDPLLGASLLKSVRSFGELGITSLNLAFYGSANLIDVPSTLPATVTDVHGMFGGASSFDGDVSGWDTGQVTDMGGMFAGASSFNQSLNSWDTSLVTNMNGMFGGASSFNQNLNSWDTDLVMDMSVMFSEASSFDGDVSGWDTGQVTTMSYMFGGASSFDGDVSGWDTGLVTDMSGMFAGASSFNQNLNSWDTDLVTNMGFMFYEATSFNQSLDIWDTGLVTDMSGMFADASSFNQSLGAWDISAVASMNNMLVGSGLSGTNYDATLNGWGAEDQVRQPNVTLDAGSLQFSRSSRAARTRLRDPSGSNWTIVDGGVQG